MEKLQVFTPIAILAGSVLIALKRRSQRNRLQWSRFDRLADIYIPKPRNAHPYPEDRFALHTRGRSRMR